MHFWKALFPALSYPTIRVREGQPGYGRAFFAADSAGLSHDGYQGSLGRAMLGSYQRER